MDMDTFLGIVRDKGLRASVTLPAELREHTDCAQMRIESGFIEARPLPYLVLVHRVDMDQQGDVPMGPVVKYSKTRYTLAQADNVKLATPPYYRDYPGKASGVRDENEAVYLESLYSYLKKWNPEALVLLEPVRGAARVGSHSVTVGAESRGSVAYCVDWQWLFCASLSP